MADYGFYLQYGSYPHALGEAAVTITKTPLRNEFGQQYGHTEAWRVSGMLLPFVSPSATPSARIGAIEIAISVLEGAYSKDGKDLKLMFRDENGANNDTAHQLLSKDCIGGTRVTLKPSFPVGDSSEYVTHRSYELEVQGDVVTGSTSGLYLAFVETLAFDGGGPMHIHLQTMTGRPQKQLTAEHTVFRVAQDGSAVGFSAYPSPPSPLWAGNEVEPRRRIMRKSPKLNQSNRSGGASTYTDWEISWHYEFESAFPMTGKDPTKAR